MKTVDKLWNDTQKIGYNIRKNGMDGLKGWQPLKERYSKINIEKFAVNDDIKNISNKCYKIGTDKKDHSDSKFICNSINMDNTIEKEHFFIQHFRIPSLENNKLSFLKLMQIAYNAGQFEAVSEANGYPFEVVNFYSRNNLERIETFIDKNRINEMVNVPLYGGNKKYIRYV